MSELGRPFLHPDLRRLIEADRNAPDPPDTMKRHVGERLDRSLGLGGAIIAAAPGLGLTPPPLPETATPSVPPPAATLFGWKALAGAAIAVAIGGAAALSFSGRAPAPVAPSHGPDRLAAAAEMAPAAAPPQGAEAAPIEVEIPGAPRAADPAAKPRATRAGAEATGAARPARRHRAPSRAAGSVDTLAAERIVLDGARAALVHHDASGALAALRSHEQAFPRGQLLEERESMRVQALSLARDFAAARAAGSRFRRQFPRSMFLPFVEQALEAAP
jgi:hypothetical protein